MTDKELRKLSRLELLELLLEVSNENKKLKERIEALKNENKTAQNIENLSAATGQVEAALKYANSLIDNLKASTHSESKHSDKREKQLNSEAMTDRGIYIRMLRFFAENDEKLSVFPSNIENDVRTRIRSILDRKK
ncbi:MAG: hypothetical protein IJ349_07620 [Clostridia bacterium]|nr:hypothetical protein [Clostridia bacterium]